jgi:NAD(P)-dependent dehydrogenase (short-subunit alcohol dehydrogenase family)
MGRLAAIELARRGAEIFVVGHNQARGAAAVEAIRATGGAAEFLQADMGDAANVCALAEAVLAKHGKIDVLIHNAGGMPPSGARTREGVDRGLAENFLGAFLLTRLLEERLLASAPARVIAVGSSTHRFVKKVDDIDAFMRPGVAPTGSYQKGNYQMRGYQVAKLAVTAWIYSVARRWAGQGVTANVLDPGMVKSEVGEHFEAPAPIRIMMNHVFPFSWRSEWNAARSNTCGSQQILRSRRCRAGTSCQAEKRWKAARRSRSSQCFSSRSSTWQMSGPRRSCTPPLVAPCSSRNGRMNYSGSQFETGPGADLDGANHRSGAAIRPPRPRRVDAALMLSGAQAGGCLASNAAW